MKDLLLIAAVLGLLCCYAGAQCPAGLSVSVSPNPAPYGTQVTVTVTNTSGTMLAFGPPCSFNAVHPGGCPPPTPAIFNTICILIIVSVPPGGSLSTTWNQVTDSGQQVLPGLYCFEINTPIGSPPCYEPVTILPCPSSAVCPGVSPSAFGSGCGSGILGAPSLNAANCAAPGSSLTVRLTSAHPFSSPLLAFGASNTSWMGIPLPLDLGGGCSLLVSLDALFPGPDTDYLGAADWVVPIPANPALLGVPVFGQAGTVGSDGLRISQGLSICM